MFKLFAAIRYLLRATTLGDSLGEIAINGIKDDILPRLTKDIKDEKDEARRTEMEAVAKLWEHFTDKSEADSRIWRNIAAKQVRENTQKMKLSPDFAADVEQTLAMNFLTQSRYKDVFTKFNPMKGPSSLAGYWITVIGRQAFVVARDMMKAQMGWGLGQQMEEGEGDEGERRPVLEQIADPRRQDAFLEAEIMSEMKSELDAAIKSQFGRNKIAMLTYAMWMDLATKKGADDINFRRDITIPLVEKLAAHGKPVGKSIIPQTWKKVVVAILKFFEEHDVHISNRVKDKMKVAERVAYDEYRMRMASWVLELRYRQSRLNSL